VTRVLGPIGRGPRRGTRCGADRRRRGAAWGTSAALVGWGGACRRGPGTGVEGGFPASSAGGGVASVTKRRSRNRRRASGRRTLRRRAPVVAVRRRRWTGRVVELHVAPQRRSVPGVCGLVDRVTRRGGHGADVGLARLPHGIAPLGHEPGAVLEGQCAGGDQRAVRRDRRPWQCCPVARPGPWSGCREASLRSSVGRRCCAGDETVCVRGGGPVRAEVCGRDNRWTSQAVANRPRCPSWASAAHPVFRHRRIAGGLDAFPVALFGGGWVPGGLARVSQGGGAFGVSSPDQPHGAG
jgi:hypothetical protein